MGVWPLYAVTFFIYFLLFGGLLLFLILAAHVVIKRRQQQFVSNNTSSVVPRSESKEPLQASFNTPPGHNSPTSPISISQMNSKVTAQSLQRPIEEVYWKVASGAPLSHQLAPVLPQRNLPRPVKMRQSTSQALTRPSDKTDARSMNWPANVAAEYNTNELYEPGGGNIRKNFMTNVDRLDDYWTSINDVVLNPTQQQQAMQRNRNQPQSTVIRPENKARQTQENIKRYTWSPPAVNTIN